MLYFHLNILRLICNCKIDSFLFLFLFSPVSSLLTMIIDGANYSIQLTINIKFYREIDCQNSISNQNKL